MTSRAPKQQQEKVRPLSPYQAVLRLCFGTVLPLVMISVCIYIQKSQRMGAPRVHTDERPHAAEPLAAGASPAGTAGYPLPQRMLNQAFLNHSCPAALVSHWGAGKESGGVRSSSVAPSGDGAVRVIVGAGFVASGLGSLAGVLQRLPGSCRPTRGSSGGGLFAAIGGGTGRGDEGESGVGPGSAGRSSNWRLPPEASTRQRYLHSLGFTRTGAGRGGSGSGGSGGGGGGGGGGGSSCTTPWELSETYTSIMRRHSTPPSVCTPLALRHYVPQARVVLMVGDPVQRAHAQQTLWLHNRCFRDAHEAAAAARGGKGRLAKGAAPNCERLDASSQLRLELECVRGCKLRPDSGVQALMQCAASCGRALRASLACKTNCPYLSLILSHYALLLPLWLRAFPCEQILLLERQTFFASGQRALSSSSSQQQQRQQQQQQQQSAAKRRVRLRQRASGSRSSAGSTGVRKPGTPAPPQPPPPLPMPPPPPSPPQPAATLLSMLRFVGVSSENASRIARAQHSTLSPPQLGASTNPIEPKLRAELDAYFRPFEAQLKRTLAAHRVCFAERSAAAAKPRPKQPGVMSKALGRAG
jgi:type II secretory pathway pseudopilin PulG